ncbi:MAG TPA: hypothetical protein VIT89_03535 [Solirubrobacterales bacterium]
MMKENRDLDDNFEERLLDELKTVVTQRSAEQELSTEPAAPSPRRRAPRLALGTAAVVAAAAGVLVFNSGSDNASKAFAVEPQDGGGVTIEVYSAEESAGLEGALAEAGIRSQVNWLPTGMMCREPHFTPSTAKTSLGGTIGGMTVGGPGPAMTIGVMSADQYRERWREFQSGEITEDEFHGSTPNLSLDPAGFRPDQTVVISGYPGPYDGDPEGGFEAKFAIAEGPVEPCDPVKVPEGSTLSQINAVVEAEKAP